MYIDISFKTHIVGNHAKFMLVAFYIRFIIFIVFLFIKRNNAWKIINVLL